MTRMVDITVTMQIQREQNMFAAKGTDGQQRAIRSHVGVDGLTNKIINS